MDSLVFLPTIGLGGILILAYLCLCRRSQKSAELPTMINLVLGAGGVVGGVVLLISCFSQALLQRLSDIKIYIFIAGLAVLYVSIQALGKELPLAEVKSRLLPNGKEDSRSIDAKTETPVLK